MEELRIVILYLSVIFTFAFGFAWMVPLATAGQKESKPTKIDATFGAFDLLLLLFDCIPFFWLFRAIPEAPSAYRAARETWRSQPTIRATFWLSVTFFALTVAVLILPF